MKTAHEIAAFLVDGKVAQAPRIPNALEHIASTWDGYICDLPGGPIDIGDELRTQFNLTAAAPPTSKAQPVPELKNINEIKRASDQSVTLVFTSCRAASAFAIAIAAMAMEPKA